MVPTTNQGISLTILFFLVLCELSWMVAGTGLDDESGSSCPKICGLPPEGGPCLKRKRFRMWYYDVGTQECRRFSYGGCRGNKNRFWTEEECRATCENCMLKTKQDEAAVVADREKLQGEICQLYPADHGKCDKANVRPSIKWSFNPSTELCEPFAYTGCGGNANRFENQHQCEEGCGNQN